MFLHLPGKCLASSVALWSTTMRLGVGEYLPEMIWNTEQHTGHEFGWAGALRHSGHFPIPAVFAFLVFKCSGSYVGGRDMVLLGSVKDPGPVKVPTLPC